MGKKPAEMQSALAVRRLTVADLNDIVTLHCAAFPASAMTKLGRDVVRRYYHWQLEGPHQMYAHGAWDEKQLIGFCFGGVHPDAITGFLKQNKGFIVWQLVKRPALLATPIIRERIPRAFDILRLIRQRNTPEAQREIALRASAYDILSMAVHPQSQGRGVGKLLMSTAEDTARTQGFDLMTLCVNVDNPQGIGFYESCGWRKTDAMDGMWCMEKVLEKPAAVTAAG